MEIIKLVELFFILQEWSLELRTKTCLRLYRIIIIKNYALCKQQPKTRGHVNWINLVDSVIQERVSSI